MSLDREPIRSNVEGPKGFWALKESRTVPAIRAGSWWTSCNSLVEVSEAQGDFICMLNIRSNCHAKDLREIAEFLNYLADTGLKVV